MTNEIGGEETKRTDVGYKRPPKEHQFRKGQKPPPRKPKVERGKESARRLLERLLREPRRVKLDGKIVWRSTGELIVRQALKVADGGSATIRRILIDLDFAAESAGEREPTMVLDRMDGSPPTIIGGSDYPDLARSYVASAAKRAADTTAGAPRRATGRDAPDESY